MSTVKRWSAHAYPGPITPTFFECKDGRYVAMADYEALRLLLVRARGILGILHYSHGHQVGTGDIIERIDAALKESP